MQKCAFSLTMGNEKYFPILVNVSEASYKFNLEIHLHIPQTSFGSFVDIGTCGELRADMILKIEFAMHFGIDMQQCR